MCERGSKIKFCSCDTRSLEPPFPYWVLYREVGKERLSVVGSFLPPVMPSVLDEITINAISEALNSSESFDFSYKPRVNDQFVLHISEERSLDFSCVKVGGESIGLYWQYDMGLRFSGSDFKRIKSGILERS